MKIRGASALCLFSLILLFPLMIVFAQTAPTIDVDPVSTAVCDGDPVSFSVTASGDPPLSYQWRLDASDLVGETASSLSIAVAGVADETPLVPGFIPRNNGATSRVGLSASCLICFLIRRLGLITGPRWLELQWFEPRV